MLLDIGRTFECDPSGFFLVSDGTNRIRPGGTDDDDDDDGLFTDVGHTSS